MARKTVDWMTDTTRDILDDAVVFELGAKDTSKRIRILDAQPEWPVSTMHWIEAGERKGSYECLVPDEECPACLVGGGYGDPITAAQERTILNVIEYTETPRGVFTEHKIWKAPMRSLRRNLKKLHKEFGDISKVDLLITATGNRGNWNAATGNGDWIKDHDLTTEVKDYQLWTPDERYTLLGRIVDKTEMKELVEIAQELANKAKPV